MNKLYFGDNLEILRDKIESESVDLVYLDPPFQSGKNYNQIFQPQAKDIKGATAQIQAFEDTWYWGQEAEREFQGLINGTITQEKPEQPLIELMKSMRGYLGECSMLAYLAMMAPRLLELRRVLKDTGSIYLHCDPTASHYLKLLMDSVFKQQNFHNEIIWKRMTPSGFKGKTNIGRGHDVILRYSKSDNFLYNPIFVSYSEQYLDERFNKVDENGRRFKDEKIGTATTQATIDRLKSEGRIYYTSTGKLRIKHYLDEIKGVPLDDVWCDIPPINSQAEERLGYPTQKPEALLERIINASSNEGDLVLDPFGGCGTTVAVAERLHRNWIGIDITYLSIDIIKKRFEKSGIKEGVDFEIDGEPKDVYSAEHLAKQDSFQFQIWCISKLNATISQTKTGDCGVDGSINFIDLTKPSKTGKGVISVKGTQAVNPAMVRDLKGTIESQNADFGILITLKEPTQGMITEAVKSGYFEYMGKQIPKLQLLNVEKLFMTPIPVNLPGNILEPFKKPRIEKEHKEKDLPFK